MCWYKNAGVAGYAEAFRPVQSDSQTSEWYSYFENDVLVVHQMMNLIVIHTSLQMLSQRIAQLRRLQELLLKQWIKLLQKK